ncbi:hypothetical protein PP7435_CHR1-0891 [Komagataella phaffii CBS 7435]|uniref:Sugar phosphate phosphatase n=2 Tax=Komagataella phaffii TaxID=460519 RepID=C4QXH9_KOMPG|nr:uncharacterized protein PAS_chr1-4_0123 [Komagataella phaffii GS115]AOA60568.1 GQ67_02063T0 [Komagataella phaffii]CAH2446766.1 hypothetical protein BQ9382_C1-4705 [Komagataella phaffii CBS 7435]AOA65819.1 GQ68_02078T0 [Komagataella phaffii GS115]CAY67952.1 Putative protein of unknown function [Komagataella phaffii GS115]CCA37026.1 hypothetical protein PP7435_CHR1-0891 [Komagataella phaffii CBS 7435]
MSYPVPFNNDPNSFAYTTSRDRWPHIIKSSVGDLESYLAENPSSKIEGAKLVQDLEKLRSDILANGTVNPFTREQLDLIPSLASYNETLASFKSPLKWLEGPWLFLETFLYRLIDVIIKKHSGFENYDIFEKSKRKAFTDSPKSVYELIKQYLLLLDDNKLKSNDKDGQYLLFKEFIDVSLWGNAIDLSLLATAAQDYDMSTGQSAAARKENEKHILANDTSKAWDHLLLCKRPKRIDIVLDNAGFEFFTDLVFSLFTLDSNLADSVGIHCKTRPWMVSDTMIKDVELLLKDLSNTQLFPDNRDEVDRFVSIVRNYLQSGKIKLLENEFWTLDLDYTHITPNGKHGGAELYDYFQDSALVIIKGDLNYRKLTGDKKWPKDTPFKTAIKELGETNIPILALRTCKADVCVGLPKQREEELVRTDGKSWCATGKWAVISFNQPK